MTIAREQVVQWFEIAGRLEGWKPGFGNDRVLGYLEQFATLARADLEAELESLRKLIKNSTEYRLGHPAYEQAAAPAMAHRAMKEKRE